MAMHNIFRNFIQDNTILNYITFSRGVYAHIESVEHYLFCEDLGNNEEKWYSFKFCLGLLSDMSITPYKPLTPSPSDCNDYIAQKFANKKEETK